MSKADCKCKEVECEECPEWIFTLADLIMCMMGLFVILWVLKPGPKPDPESPMDPEMVKVVAAIREAFGYLPDPSSKDPVDVHMLLKKLETLKPLNGPGDGGQTKLKRKGAEGTDPEVTKIRPGIQAGIGGRMLFDTGDARLTPETSRALEQIAALIRGHRNIVLVKGHASLDDFATEDANTPQRQRDLAIRRAQAAADYLTARGVDPEILRLQECSVFEPVKQRAYAAEGQAANRRVEV